MYIYIGSRCISFSCFPWKRFRKLTRKTLPYLRKATEKSIWVKNLTVRNRSWTGTNECRQSHAAEDPTGITQQKLMLWIYTIINYWPERERDRILREGCEEEWSWPDNPYKPSSPADLEAFFSLFDQNLQAVFVSRLLTLGTRKKIFEGKSEMLWDSWSIMGERKKFTGSLWVKKMREAIGCYEYSTSFLRKKSYWILKPYVFKGRRRQYLKGEEK